MKSPKLIPDALVCECCGNSATPLKRKPDEPVVMALHLSVTRRGKGKRVTRAAGSVRVCDRCAIAARVGGLRGANCEGRKILAALLERFASCYSSLLREDAGAA